MKDENTLNIEHKKQVKCQIFGDKWLTLKNDNFPINKSFLQIGNCLEKFIDDDTQQIIIIQKI